MLPPLNLPLLLLAHAQWSKQIIYNECTCICFIFDFFLSKVGLVRPVKWPSRTLWSPRCKQHKMVLIHRPKLQFWSAPWPARVGPRHSVTHVWSHSLKNSSCGACSTSGWALHRLTNALSCSIFSGSSLDILPLRPGSPFAASVCTRARTRFGNFLSRSLGTRSRIRRLSYPD